MRDRILQIMQKKQMSQKVFADTLGIAASSLSSILNGRTAPTNNHIQAIHRTFPEINVNWLMFGEGEMTLHSSASPATPVSPAFPRTAQPVNPEMGDLFSSANVSRVNNSPILTTPEQISPQVIEREIVKYTDKPQRRVTEVHVYFDDGTFEKFSGIRE